MPDSVNIEINNIEETILNDFQIVMNKFKLNKYFNWLGLNAHLLSMDAKIIKNIMENIK